MLWAHNLWTLPMHKMSSINVRWYNYLTRECRQKEVIKLFQTLIAGKRDGQFSNPSRPYSCLTLSPRPYGLSNRAVSASCRASMMCHTVHVFFPTPHSNVIVTQRSKSPSSSHPERLCQDLDPGWPNSRADVLFHKSKPLPSFMTGSPLSVHVETSEEGLWHKGLKKIKGHL